MNRRLRETAAFVRMRRRMRLPIRPVYLVATAAELTLILQGVVIWLVLWQKGIVLGITEAVLPLLSLAYYLGGALVRVMWEVLRGRVREYLSSIATVEWWVITARIIPTTMAISYIYAALKTHIPILQPRTFDALLWEIDRALLFGHSPNVLLLNLFHQDSFLRAMDFLYAILFFTALMISVPVILSVRSNPLRVAYTAGSVILWSVGLWLYLAVPSLGPAYVVSDVWDEVRHLFPRSTYWQYRLIQNYQLVLQIREGVLPPGINMLFGIAAFPSLHVGFQTFVALWMSRVSRWAGMIGFLFAAIIFLGSVLTGWHYLIDSIAGAILAVLSYLVSRRLEKFMMARPA